MHYKLDYDVIEVNGEDRTTFLQGQLTCDITTIKQGALQLGACCDVKGRAIASMLIRIESQTLLLCLPKGMGAVLCEHLHKYAVFSRVTLTVLDDMQVYGSLTPTDNSQALPSDPPRFITLTKTPIADASNDSSDWDLANIDAHFALITPAQSGQIIPLMLNYAALGGISFDKGCYVGQEIIARMHYKGKIKRHLKTISCDNAALKSGDSLYDDKLQPLGVILSGVSTGQTTRALALIQDRALGLTLMSSDNRPILIPS
jgi:tRNA-modifying protein YgfZ